MEFCLNPTPHGTGKVVHLSGHFTFADNKRFKKLIEETRSLPMESLEVNLDAVEFVDSAALGMLLLLREECAQRHVPVSITSPQGQVGKMLTLSKFDRLFHIQPTNGG